jgi:hypothetical protein
MGKILARPLVRLKVHAIVKRAQRSLHAIDRAEPVMMAGNTNLARRAIDWHCLMQAWPPFQHLRAAQHFPHAANELSEGCLIT